MLRIAICDDSLVDSTIINEYVSEYLTEKNMTAEVKVFNHPDSLIAECESFRPHIYVLDIVMPMVTGIEAAKELRWNQKESQIIFTTADASFALESFEVNPINYLLKPVSKDKFFETMDMSLRRVELDSKKTVTVKVKGGYETVYLDEILYLDYRNHIVTYHLENGKEINTTTLRIGFLQYLQNNLSDEDFIPCHESIAINLKAVEKLSRDGIILKNKENLPVSKSRYKEVYEKIIEGKRN